MTAHSRGSGRLIAVEGSDGSGKATQSRLLVQRLRAEGYPAERISFPRYGRSFFGRLAGAYLRGELGGAAAVDPRLAAMIYAADRWEAREAILRWLAEGRVVVCDRYVDSNKAHQAARLPRGADKAGFLRWVDRMEYRVFGLPGPDFTLYLHVPHRLALHLIGRKGRRPYLSGRERDLHEADPAHLRRAERIYLDLASRRGPSRGALIRCVRAGRLLTRAEVHERIWAAVRAFLARRD